MTELEDFLAETIERHVAATTAVRNGDPAPFLEQLSTHDPMTLFPASQPPQVGRQAISQAIRNVASVYSGSSDVAFEVLASGVFGDLAYVVGFERAASAIEGGSREELVLRVTQVYRREDGEWKVVHRHADPGPGGPAEHLRQVMRERG